MKYFYYIYQLLVALPVTVIITILTAVEVGVGCAIGDGHFWGYYPGRWWARIITRIFLLPVKVEGL
jgi:1-acyl-sn-glycerol-3-phosphate acyltransferase